LTNANISMLIYVHIVMILLVLKSSTSHLNTIAQSKHKQQEKTWTCTGLCCNRKKKQRKVGCLHLHLYLNGGKWKRTDMDVFNLNITVGWLYRKRRFNEMSCNRKCTWFSVSGLVRIHVILSNKQLVHGIVVLFVFWVHSIIAIPSSSLLAWTVSLVS
jgi:hypothetical protein